MGSKSLGRVSPAALADGLTRFGGPGLHILAYEKESGRDEDLEGRGVLHLSLSQPHLSAPVTTPERGSAGFGRARHRWFLPHRLAMHNSPQSPRSCSCSLR